MRIHQPRYRSLRKPEGLRVAGTLGRIPLTEPEVVIQPLEGEGFEIEYNEGPESFVPLEAGAEGFYADYDAASRRLLEANYVQVPRRVMAQGMWCMEVYETGGVVMDGRLNVEWRERVFYRVGKDSIFRFDPLLPEVRREFPRHVGPDVTVKLANADTAKGPKVPGPHVAGFCTVEIGGRQSECVRLLSVSEEPGQPKGAILDDVYIERGGRTVLVRRLQSPESHEAYAELFAAVKPKGQRRSKAKDKWPEGRAKLSYNGSEFYHWFDILTDAAVAPHLLK